MNIIKGLLAVLFLAFSAVQYNDPDSWVWIIIYIVPVVLYILSIKERYYPLTSIILGLLYFVGFFLLFTFNSTWLYIEEGREGMGLLIAGVAVCSVSLFKTKTLA